MLVAVASFVIHHTPPGAAARPQALTSFESARSEINRCDDEAVGAGTSRRAGDRERGDSDGEGPRCRPHSHLAASGEGFGAPRRLAMKSRYQ